MTIRIPANKRGIQEKVFVHEWTTRTFTPTAGLIFGFLAFSICKKGQATHSKSTLARRIHCERKTIQLNIKKMVEAGWLKTAPCKNASNNAFLFGDKCPEQVIRSYRALIKRSGKQRDDGFLIGVDLAGYDKLDKEDINHKKAAQWRTLAYVRALLAYRNASHAMRNDKQARAKYKNLTALANHLNVCLKTAKRYLSILSDAGEVVVVWDKGLCVDAAGALFERALEAYQKLKKLQYLDHYDPVY